MVLLRVLAERTKYRDSVLPLLLHIGTMAFALQAGASLHVQTRRRACSSSNSAFTTAPPRRAQRPNVFQNVSSAVCNRRLVRKVAAIEEQETAYQQPEDEQAVAAAATPEDPAELKELELQHLDAAQEDLLKWMLYVDEDAQEEDLDEMVDFEDLGDEEYEEIWEEVEDMLESNDYDFKCGDKVLGFVHEVDDDGAYVEIGAKAAGFVPLSECSLAKLKTVSSCI